MGEFGDKFRKAREKKELSLDDVSNVTKISTRMLQAIEQEHFDELPGGVFNRGFIRAYAKHLGLDSEDAVNDYLACLRQEQIDSHAGWDPQDRPDPRSPVVTKSGPAAPARQTAKVEAPVEVEELPELQLPRAEHIRPKKKEFLDREPAGVPWTLIGVVALVVFAAAFFWIRHNRRTQPAAAIATTAPAGSISSSATPAAATVSLPTSAPTATVTPTPAVQPPPQPARSAPATPSTATRPVTPAPTEAATDPNAVKVEKKGDVTIRSFGAAAAPSPNKPADKPASTLTLVVRASENSWISVTSDGQLVTQETLIAPAATSFHASRELVIRVGNAAGISFLWNGQEFPAQGAEGEAKTFVFDAQGMRSGAPTQP